MTAELPMTTDEAALQAAVRAAGADLLPRLVYADWLDENHRGYEAGLCRGDAEITIATTGRVVRADAAEAAARHGRVARPARSLTCTVFCGRRRSEGVGRAVGDVVRRKDGMHVVVSVGTPRHVNDDHIDDMDAWAEYPDGPGYYGDYGLVAVEESDAERAERESAESAAAAKRTAAEEKKQAEDEAWGDLSDLPQVYTLPAGVDAKGLAWETISDYRTRQPMGYYGTVRSVAALPTGERIGRVDSIQYDDPRTWYHVPQAVIDRHAERTASADRLRDLELAHRFPADHGKGRTKDEVAAEWDRAAAEHYALYGDAPAGLSPAMKSREKEAVAALPADWAEAVRDVVARDAGAKSALYDYALSGDAALRRVYLAMAESVGGAAHESRAAAYAAAASEWMPKIAAEFGDGAASAAAAEVKADCDQYAHADDPAERFQDRLESLRKDRAAAAERAAKAAARKADPMVKVTGNTYPHRAALERIPGSKLSKLKGGWTWKVPQSQTGKLPRGLGWE